MFKKHYKFVSNNIEESLICSVCQQPFQEPIDSCCKHTFCKLCLQYLFENNEDCPICQQPFSNKEYQISVNSEIINQKISYLDVQCPNYTNGCKSPIKLIDLGEHVEKCLYREIKCPYGCDEKIIFNEKYKHVKTCAKTQDLCPFCQSTIEKGQQKSHYEKTCQCYPMKCVHSIYGCQGVVQRKDYNNHLKDCKYHKVRGLIVFSEISETMLRMFQDEIDKLHFEVEQLQEITGLIETDNEWKENQKKLFYQKKSSQNKQPTIKKNDPKKNKLIKIYSAPLSPTQRPNLTTKALQQSKLSPVNQRKPMYIQTENKQSPIKKPDQSIQNKQSPTNTNNKNKKEINKEINTQIGEQKPKIVQEEKKETTEKVKENSHTILNQAIEIEIKKETKTVPEIENEKENIKQNANNTVKEKQIEIEKGNELQNQKMKEETNTKKKDKNYQGIENKPKIIENKNEEKENKQKENEQKENEQKKNEEKKTEIQKERENEEKNANTNQENKQNKNEEKENVQNENLQKENEQKEIEIQIENEEKVTKTEEKENENENEEKEKESEQKKIENNKKTETNEKETKKEIEIEKENQIQSKKEFKLRGIDREVQSPDGSDFLRLDDELIFEIMDYLDVISFFRIGLVNSKFQTLRRNSQRPWTLLDFTGMKFHGQKEWLNIFNTVSDVRCVNLTDSLRYSNQRTIAEIIVTLMNFQNLESLILCKNFCNSLGEMFNILLPENNTLLHLDLSWNFMGHGVVHLATGLSNNFTLKSLDITQNYAKDEGAVALANSLKNHNKTLTSLNISSNGIRQEGGNALVEMLKVNNTLKKLIVTSNLVGIKNDLEIKSLLKK
ncbi:rich repeat and nacht domain-containing protein [Anaeramoeba flamelloides]|uniref:Rich repeat and nacht domain-containing protein n=1 Tax=Anaeramoeba flamelloides TaxID=1746091 RepID=A0AAV8AF25_9EUKA|nr:rich repeat and nacht domain-containing protein [Anaeramoeba flamelloides]